MTGNSYLLGCFFAELFFDFFEDFFEELKLRFELIDLMDLSELLTFKLFFSDIDILLDSNLFILNGTRSNYDLYFF